MSSYTRTMITDALDDAELLRVNAPDGSILLSVRQGGEILTGANAKPSEAAEAVLQAMAALIPQCWCPEPAAHIRRIQ